MSRKLEYGYEQRSRWSRMLSEIMASQHLTPSPPSLSHWERGVGVRESNLWDNLRLPDGATKASQCLAVVHACVSTAPGTGGELAGASTGLCSTTAHVCAFGSISTQLDNGTVEEVWRPVILNAAKNLAHLSCNELEILRRSATAGLIRMTSTDVYQQPNNTYIAISPYPILCINQR